MHIGILEYNNEIKKQLLEVVGNECPNANIITWESSDELKQAVKKGPSYKILFLSLRKEAKEIISYTRRLQEINPEVKIVFLSELNEVLFDVFEADPIYVLQLPLKEDRVKQAIHKALSELTQSGEKIFTIINKQGIFTVPYDDIYYVESDKRKLNIYGQAGLIKSINLKISDFLAYEHGCCFLQCHKSYAVNLRHISQLEKYSIILKNSMELPISQSRYADTKAGYVKYLENE